MADTETRVREEFALFERDSALRREGAAAAFGTQAEAFRTELNGLERELKALEERAYENVSQGLRLFEEEFSADLTTRREAVNRQLEEWKQTLDGDLAALAEEAGEERRNLESAYTGELKNRLAEQQTALTGEFEALKTETGALEEDIRNRLSQSDQSLISFKEQLDRDLEEARRAAEVSVKAEIGRYALSAAENLKQAQRDLSASLKEIEEQVEARNGELSALQEASRREIEEWQTKLTARIRDADSVADDVRRKLRELAAETDDRVAGVRSAVDEVYAEADSHRTELFTRIDEQVRLLDSSIKEADRHIKEFVTQTKLFEQTDALKLDLARRIEDFRSDLARLDQRRAEAAELETQFTKIRRLEDDINGKMTRFLTEQRRVDRMEEDFNRLILTSQAVEEKLSQVTASDDTLQAIQIQIRRLSGALDETEEQYRRIEKKNETLEAVTQGIDRNFKVLQETEGELKRFGDELFRLSQVQDQLRLSVEKLTEENEKARLGADKLSILSGELSGLEERIEAMQVAREWLARTETRLEELDQELRQRIKMAGNLVKGDPARDKPRSKGAPPLATRESVIKLARMGWTVDEIASGEKLSKAEVELIIEMGVKE
jgi:chromosome segregation ATPase